MCLYRSGADWCSESDVVSNLGLQATDGNTDTQLQNVHHYDSDFNSLTHMAWQGIGQTPPQGSVVTEAGCRWYQGESKSSGSPLEMINWLQALRAAQAPYIPGAFLAWTVIVGNDNTRCKRQLRHHLCHFLATSRLYPTPHAPCAYAQPGAHANRVLLGAWNPMR